MGWTLYDSALTYLPNFVSRIQPHGANSLLWVGNNTSPPNYVIQYDIAAKTENIISLEVANGGVNYKGSSPGAFGVASDGTNIFGLSSHAPDISASGGTDHAIWDHSTGTNWTEATDIGPNAGAYDIRFWHIDGRFYAPKTWSDLGPNSRVLHWVSTDGINWAGEQVTNPIGGFAVATAGTFNVSPISQTVKLNNGKIISSGRENNSHWYYYERIGTSWVRTFQQPANTKGVDQFAMSSDETFSRLYRVSTSSNALQYSIDEGNSWNNCETSDTSELITTTNMSGATVVYGHAGREFIGFNKFVNTVNRVYALYEFNSITEKFDHIDDMPVDSNSLQGAFVWNNELYIHHNGDIYKHDGLSFGEVVSSEFDLTVGGYFNHQGDKMAVSDDGLSVLFALESQTGGLQKIYKENLSVGPTVTSLIYDPQDATGSQRGCQVYNAPNTNSMILAGKFGDAAGNVKSYDLSTDALSAIDNGSSPHLALLVGRNASAIYATRLSSSDIVRRRDGSWVDISTLFGASELINGAECMAGIFFDGFIDDYLFVLGVDENGLKRIYFSPNEFSDVKQLQGSAFPDLAGDPWFSSVDVGFDG